MLVSTVASRNIIETRLITRTQHGRAYRHFMRETDSNRTTKMAEAISKNLNRHGGRDNSKIEYLPSSDGVADDDEIA